MKTVNIVGASISGLSTALELLKLDRQVAVRVVEQKACSDTICGGAISSFMLQEMKLKIPYWTIASKVNNVRMYSPNSNFWDLKSEDRIYGYVLWRNEVEWYLTQKIRKIGGLVDFNQRVTSIDEHHIYVAADGLNGVCRKNLNLPLPNLDDIHIGVQREAKLNHPSNRMELYFGNEYAPRGYAWIFPLGKNMVRIGLAIPLNEKKNPQKLLTKFINWKEAEPLTPMRAKLIPTAKPSRKLFYNNVLLVGDAGLLCDPATGGGIANAYLSGKFAAQAIHQNNIHNYERYCSGIKRRNKSRYVLKKILYDLSDEDFNDLIDGMKNFRPKLIRISWAMAMALAKLAIKKPKLMMKHKVLRRFVGYKG